MSRGRARGLAAAALAAVALAWGAPATGAAPAEAAPSVALVGQTTWVHRGERFDVHVQVTDAPADAALRLVVHEAPTTRLAFRRTLEGGLGDVISNGPRQPLTQLPASAPGSYSAGFAVGGAGVDLPGRGAYPVEVQLLAGDGSQLDGFVTYLSYLSRPSPEFTPLDVAVVLDVGGGPPILQPDGSRQVGDDTLARIRERVEVLDETPTVPLTVAPVPEALDGLAAPDEPAGAALLERLGADAQRRGALARPFVDVDLTALDQADLSGEAVEQRDTGLAVARDRLGVQPTTGIWLAGGTLGPEAARRAVGLGYDRALVPPSAVEPAGRAERSGRSGRGDAGDGAGTVPETPVRLGDGLPLGMVEDAALAKHLTASDGVLGAHRFIGELTAMWLEAPALPRAVAVRIPGDAAIDPASVAVAITGLGDGQAAKAVGLDQLFADVPPAEGGAGVATLAAHDVAHDLTPIAAGVQAARSGIAGVAGVTGDPTSADEMRRSLLVSTGTATPDDARPAYVDHVNQALGAVAGAVTLPDQFRITLTSRSSSVPIQLTNNTDRDVNVMVQVDSDQLEFPQGDFIATTLVPGTTRIEVPVKVRTSGAFTMVVRVTSPDGSLLLDTSTFDIRSTAISGVGLLLSIGAGLFLAVWWLRNWRSARRSRHLMPRGGEPDPALDGDGARVPEEVDAAYRPAHLAGDHAVQGRSGVVR